MADERTDAVGGQDVAEGEMYNSREASHLGSQRSYC